MPDLTRIFKLNILWLAFNYERVKVSPSPRTKMLYLKYWS